MRLLQRGWPDDIVSILKNDLLPIAVSKFADAKLVDYWVGKYYGTVSWFSPGSYALRPPLEGAGNDILPNVKCAGDSAAADILCGTERFSLNCWQQIKLKDLSKPLFIADISGTRS